MNRNKLSVRKVQTAGIGWHGDGGGLYLQVTPGGRSWVYRFKLNGRERYAGLGSAADITLAEARDRALAARKLRLDGIDPIEARKAQRAAAAAASAAQKTFRECAEEFLEEHAAKWSNAKHAQQWKNTLAAYVYPELGSLSVAAINTPLVLKVIKPLWKRAPVTAGRVRGRIEQILDWATVQDYRSGNNPARWRDHLVHALPAPQEVNAVEHHAALPYAEAPAFVAKLRQDASVAARCLEFILLTAARSSEATEATWNEINLDDRVWVVPAGRMKGGREHCVPLPDAAVRILEQMAALRQSDYVFPGLRAGRPIGHNVIWKLAKSLGTTTHGLRSTFRDWAAEKTNFANHVAEMALAHKIPSAVEEAYRRGTMLEKRRQLMDEWAKYCEKGAISPKVVPLRTRSTYAI